MVKRRELFLFFLLLLLGIFFIYLYGYIQKTKDEIFTRIEANEIQNVSEILKNIESSITKNHSINKQGELIYLFSDDNVRAEYESKLSLFITPNLKYMYLLCKDKKDRFRFLLDASKEDKASFYQKFDLYDEEYKTIYKTALPQIIRQHDIENLYLTYLYPIKNNSNKVLAILSVDITTKIQTTILELISPIETFFVILIIFIFLLMLMTIIQVFHYFMTRKKIFIDPLTKLFNRNYLQEILPTINYKNYSLAMLDLDRFKTINDTYGHKTGDYVLSKSGEILKDSVRESDILIRYGGEEFLLFIYNRNDNVSAKDICERIRKNVSNSSFNYDENEIKVQVSIGVHENPFMEKNIKDAIKIADKMLYIAKKQGRNRVIYYDEKSENNDMPRVKGINFVKSAIEKEMVVCYYQPIYNRIDKKILKYEALVRIIDTKGAIVQPMDFLPGLKHTNVHYKLTQRILNIVFDEFKENDKHVSINMNFSDLINNDIEKTIIDTFKKYKDLASRVTFEILESDEIDNLELFKSKVDLLHSLGSKVSIDDFGSGYSNFRTILDIEADILKIDGSLIKNIDKNEKDFKVVKSIVLFAKEANMKIVAEFVHSKAVYDKLQLLDVNYLQGYYIAKPTGSLVEPEELFN